MASLSRRPNKDGSTTIRVRWGVPPTGGRERERRERTFTIPAGASKKEAREVEDAAAQFKRDIEREGGVAAYEAGRITVAELAARFLAAKERRVSPATHRSYRGTLERHVLPVLGAVPLARVRAYEVEGWLRAVQDAGAADGTVRTWWRHLSMLFRQAVKWDLLPKSPCDGVDAPPAGRGRERVLTAGEEAAFLRAIHGDPYEALWRVLLHGGLRVGEALALRWCDVDLDAGAVTVCRTVTKAAGGGLEIREGTKTGPARRVAVNARVVAAFAARKELVAPRFAAECCFGQPGNWMRPAAAGKRLAVLRKKAGLPDEITCHVLRHTHITALRRGGVHYSVIARRVGHAALATTYGYDHPDEADDRRAAEVAG